LDGVRLGADWSLETYKVTQYEIIRMAREAGNGDEDWLILTKQLFKHFPKEMERFAALVAEATKEKMKKVFAVATPKSTWTTDRIIAEIEDMK
jgi:hypothetical protein